MGVKEGERQEGGNSYPLHGCVFLCLPEMQNLPPRFGPHDVPEKTFLLLVGRPFEGVKAHLRAMLTHPLLRTGCLVSGKEFAVN
jgi:hypothetical protein